MTQETMLFAIHDVKAIAEHVIENSYAIDTSGAISRDGARYCTGCGAYEVGGPIVHDHNCVVKIAQDVLTGLTPNGPVE